MKKLTKRLLPLFIAAIMICSLPMTALATNTASTLGVSVQIGDTLVSFTDSNPEIQNGRVFVPVRAICEKLGAQVSYDDVTKIATAVKGDTTVQLQVGEKSLTVTSGDTTQTIQMDVASYVQNNRLMVPTRFLAQAFDCYVGWDSVSRTAIILDVNGLLRGNNAQYTLMDKYLAYSNKFAQNYAISGTFNISAEINNDGTTVPVISNGTIDAIYDSKAVNLNLGMTLDITDLIAALGDEESQDAQTALILNMLKNVNVEYIVNIDEGMVYVRSSLLSIMMGADEGTWYSIDMNKLFSESGASSSYSELMAANKVTTSFEDTIETVCSMIELTDVETVNMLTEGLTFINTAFSDAAFVKSGDTYTTNKSFDEDGVTASFSFCLTVKDDAVTGYDLTMKAVQDDMTMDMTCSQDANDKMVMSIIVDMPDTLKISYTVDLQYSKTTKAAAVAPETGSTIVPLPLD